MTVREMHERWKRENGVPPGEAGTVRDAYSGKEFPALCPDHGGVLSHCFGGVPFYFCEGGQHRRTA